MNNNDLNCLTFEDLEEMIVFAQNKNGKDVFIDDAENGLACNLVCKFCGNPMIARNGGNVLRHHFAHANGSDCKKGHESQLPLLFGRLLSAKCEIYLPNGSVIFKGERVLKSTKIRAFGSTVSKYKDFDVPIVQTTMMGNTDQPLTIYVYSNFNSEMYDSLIHDLNHKNVICINLSSFKGTKKQVLKTLNDVLEWGHYSKWLKLSFEEKYIKKFKELGTWYAYNNKSFVYCPRSKKKYISLNDRENQCSSCPYSLMNILINDNTYYYQNKKCIGYIDDDITIKTIFDAKKVDFLEIEKPTPPQPITTSRQLNKSLSIVKLHQTYGGRAIKVRNLYNNKIFYFYFEDNGEIYVRKTLLNGTITDKILFKLEDDTLPNWEFIEKIN